MWVPKCPCCGDDPTIYTLRWSVWGHFCYQHQKNIWWDYTTFTFMGRDYLILPRNYLGDDPI